MFCPNAADYGNVADWVSGIGSMGAVFVALGIALRDSRQRRADDRARELRAAQDENAMIVQALVLYRDLFRNANRTIEAFDGSGEAITWNEMQNEANAIGETAVRLQRLPAVNIRMYTEFERIAQLSRRVALLSHDHDDLSAITDELKLVRTEAQNANESLRENPNPLAPLNW